ncbi:DM13 domain-containing protein [Cupriavidus nantongensis]|uniref:DM13 domain-containing protein n=1 Tax=Cupriavidus nantongensis TaxID=1796606 RepID=UPI00358E6C2C
MPARPALLVVTHLAMLAVGFAAGIYVLPILTAQPGASAGQVQAISQQSRYSGTFRKDLAGSDALHWASGRLHVSARALAFEGSVAPGPDYRIYLAPAFVDNKEAFLRIKDQSLQVSELKTFGNFTVDLPPGVDPSRYAAVVIWCERFGQFIGAAGYR